MKLFIWTDVYGMNSLRHKDDGAIVAIAPSLDRARELINNACSQKWQRCTALDQEPDYIYEVIAEEEKVITLEGYGYC